MAGSLWQLSEKERERGIERDMGPIFYATKICHMSSSFFFVKIHFTTMNTSFVNAYK